MKRGPEPRRRCSGSGSRYSCHHSGERAKTPAPVRLNAIPDRRQHASGFLDVDQPHACARFRLAAKSDAITVGADRCLERRDAVAETTVDRLLRGPEDRERLATAECVVELAAHELRQDPAPPVARHDADHRHSRGRQLAAGDSEEHRQVGRGADDRAVVVGAEHPLGRDHLAVALDVLLVDLVREARLAGPEPVLHAHPARGCESRRSSGRD